MPSFRLHAAARGLVAAAFLSLIWGTPAWGAQNSILATGKARMKEGFPVPAMAVVGQPFSYAFRFNDANNPANPCPAGMTVVPTSTLPPGLNLSSTGVLQGTPTTAGTFPFTFNATGPDPQKPCGTTTPFSAALTVQPTPVTQTAPQVVTPQALASVTAPSQQLSNVQQRLDNLRIARNPTVTQGLNLSYGGHPLPPLSALLAAPDEKDGGAVSQRGGGASADKDEFERYGVFVQGNVDIGKLDASGNQPGFDLHTYGVTFGGDYRFAGNNVLGVAFGFVKANTDLDSNAGSQDTKGWSVSIFGEYVPAENAYIDLALTYGQNRYDGVRVDTQSAPQYQYDSNPRGNQFGVALSAGYQFYYEALTLNPYGRVEYIDTSIDAFQETAANGGLTPLSVSEQRYKSTVLTLGGQAQYAWSQTWGVLVPYARIEYNYAAQSSANAITAQYIGFANGQPVPVPGTDKSYGTIGAGVTAVVAKGLSGYFNYEYLFGKANFTNNSFTLGIRYDF